MANPLTFLLPFRYKNATFNTEIFRNRDLHMRDMLAGKERLKNAITQTKSKQVLDGLLAKIMINSINLRFVQSLGHCTLNLGGLRPTKT